MDPASQPPEEMSALERRLLDAARNERIPDALGARMAEGLGLHVASSAPSVSPAAGGKVGAPLFAKAGLWGALSVAVVAGVVGWRAAQPATPADHAAAGAPEVHAARQDEATPTVVEPETATAIERTPTPIERTSQPTPAVVDHVAPARSSARVDDDALRAEVALLDQARVALRAGQAGRALRLLDQRRQRFTRGRLAPEAAALRIEALVQQGSYARAEAMSRQFETAYPSHPLRERVSTLGRTGSTRAQHLASPAR